MVGDKSVSEPLGASTGDLGQPPSTVETVVGDQPVNEPLRSTGNPGQAPSTLETVVNDQTVAHLLGTSIANPGQPPPTGDMPKVPAKPSIAASTEATSQPLRAKSTWSIGKWLRLPGAELLAEQWFARRASRELLDAPETLNTLMGVAGRPAPMAG